MICFAWDGFPQYAARCIGAFVKTSAERVVVVATRPFVPIQGMEKFCGCEVLWVDGNDRRSLKALLGEMPRVLLVSGWAIPAFNRYRDEVRVAGGTVVGMCDNNLVLDFKQLLRAIRFRLLIRGKYSAFFVPGKNGVKLLRFYGVPKNKIVTGMYAADAGLFSNGRPILEREKRMIFVGQFCERKNVRRLVQAFIQANVPDWTLDLYGTGPLKKELLTMLEQAGVGSVLVHDFVQPEQLAGLYRSARLFCLPSLWEHWGLVVHEAALSGCVLLLSKTVGAADDLLTEDNGFSFNPYDCAEMVSALRRAMGMTDTEMVRAQKTSLEMAGNASLEKFVEGVNLLIEMQ